MNRFRFGWGIETIERVVVVALSSSMRVNRVRVNHANISNIVIHYIICVFIIVLGGVEFVSWRLLIVGCRQSVLILINKL